MHSPFGRLAAPLVRCCLLRFLAETGSTVGILLSHGPSVGQVLCPVNYGHQSADDGSVHRHVREDARRVLAAHGVYFGKLRSHDWEFGTLLERGILG